MKTLNGLLVLGWLWPKVYAMSARNAYEYRLPIDVSANLEIKNKIQSVVIDDTLFSDVMP